MTHSEVGSRDGLSWDRRRDALILILRGVTFHTASRVALVVGTLLTVVNQGEVLLHGEQTAVTWVRVAFNYAIPYFVASIGYLAPLRRREPDPEDDDARLSAGEDPGARPGFSSGK